MKLLFIADQASLLLDILLKDYGNQKNSRTLKLNFLLHK